MNRKIPVIVGKFPAAILFPSESLLVGKELFGYLILRLAGGSILRGANDNDAIVPAGVLAGMKARRENGVFLHIAQLFLPFQNSNLVLLEYHSSLYPYLTR